MASTSEIPDVGPADAATSSRAVVSCAHPAAADAGITMFNSGGNAFDALVAMSWALTVAEPTMSGLFGVNTVLTRSKKYPEGRWLDGVSNVCAELTPEALQDGRGQGARGIDVLAPTLVAANAKLLADLGTMTLAQTLEPAINLAEYGVALSPTDVYWFRLAGHNVAPERVPELYQRAQVSPGELFVQPAMAAALRSIRDEGSASFISGHYARAAVAAVQANGGVLSLDDIEQVDPQWRDCIAMDIEGVTLIAPGAPNCSYEALATIATAATAHSSSSFPADSDDSTLSESPEARRSARSWQLFIDAARLSAQDRISEWCPKMSNSEATALISTKRIEARVAKLSARQSGGAAASTGLDMSWVEKSDASHTSHLAAADSDGNVACSTQTLGGLFGCQVWADGLPINGLGAYLLSGDPSAPDSLAPRPELPLASILEMLICVRNGEFRFTMGSPGGFVIPPAVAHGTLAALRTAQSADVDLVDVVSTPRLAPINDGVVIVESRISDNVRTHVSATATVKDVGPWSWLLGSLNCVGANQSGELIGVADPRRGGAARAAS